MLDMFSAGSRAAFHARVDGVFQGGVSDIAHRRGLQMSLYAAGVVTVSEGYVTKARVVTDRLSAVRRLSEPPN